MAYYSNKAGPSMTVWAAVLMLVIPHSSLAGELADPPVSKQKQAVNRLLAMTKAGYYSALLVTNRQAKWLPGARLKATAAPCSGSCFTLAPMPVKLINFSGQRLDATQVQLNWTTSAEINNDYFGVQRSANPAAGFETIGSVKGRGSSSENVAYQFTDVNTETGYTYYRLKQVDLDGTFAYSQIIAIKGYQEALSVKAYPNPSFQKELTFQVSCVKSGESLSVTIFDARGAVVYQNSHYGLDINQQISLTSLSSLLAGAYYIRVSTSQQQASATFIVAL